jgi:hypothetical protein
VFYPIIEDENVFSFETETRNKVSVEFSDLTSIFESFFPIYCVDIYRLQGFFHTNEFNGTKTRDTIVNIIKNFLDRFDCALVAFIDTSTDKKGKARNHLFKSWFEMFGNRQLHQACQRTRKSMIYSAIAWLSQRLFYKDFLHLLAL